MRWRRAGYSASRGALPQLELENAESATRCPPTRFEPHAPAGSPAEMVLFLEDVRRLATEDGSYGASGIGILHHVWVTCKRSGQL